MKAKKIQKKAVTTPQGIADVLELSALLKGAFVWEDTPQGHDYWSKVNARLLALIE